MTRGGARPGAGRPQGTKNKTPGLPTAVFVRLTEAELDKAKALGNGNASAGMRAALAASPECDSTLGRP